MVPVLSHLRDRLLRRYHPDQAQHQLDVDSSRRGTKGVYLHPICRDRDLYTYESHCADLHSYELYSD